MAIAISMTMARDLAARAWEARAQGTTAWGGGYGPGVRGGYRAAKAQGATGLRKTSGKSYGKLGLRNAGAKER